MAFIISDCPRCGYNRTSFDIYGSIKVGELYDWKNLFEIFSVCRHCYRCTIFLAEDIDPESSNKIALSGVQNMSGSLSNYLKVSRFISVIDNKTFDPPPHIPPQIASIFREGSTCFRVECYNAAATMFRLCIDLATRDLVPTENIDGVNRFIREKLSPRLTWLFDNDKLPQDLRGLSDCIKEDGNDGAHEGNLTKEDAEDLLDFTTAILERLYSIPAQVKLAEERRAKRRSTE